MDLVIFFCNLDDPGSLSWFTNPTARVTLARGLKDSPGLQAKFSGRVTLLPETTLRLFRFGYFVIKARTDNKTGK